jgi:hypothetical protein
MKRNSRHEGVQPEGEYANWLDESFGRREGDADGRPSLQPQSEPLYEQTRRAAGLHEDRRRQ